MKALVLLVTVSLSTAAFAFEGTWTASRDDARNNRIYLQMTRGRSHNMGHAMSLDAFTGLTDAQIDADTATPVAFAMRREAGDLNFQGTFRKGEGAGQFTFTAKPAFLESVRALGVDVDRRKHVRGETQDELLYALAACDVSVAFIQSMIAEGYRVTLDDYLTMRIFDITPEFIHEMRDLGFAKISHDELVACKIHGVTPSYVRDMREQGWDLSLDDYEANRIHGVTPEFSAQMRKLGFSDLSRDDLLAFRIHGVTGEFIHEMRDLGYDLSADDLISARIHGVTPEFIKEVREAGYAKVPFNKLLALRMSGFDTRSLGKVY